jgi:predicted aconitase with swiveling domain
MMHPASKFLIKWASIAVALTVFYGAALPALLNSDADVFVIIGAILTVAVPVAVVAYVVHAFKKFQKEAQ